MATHNAYWMIMAKASESAGIIDPLCAWVLILVAAVGIFRWIILGHTPSDRGAKFAGLATAIVFGFAPYSMLPGALMVISYLGYYKVYVPHREREKAEQLQMEKRREEKKRDDRDRQQQLDRYAHDQEMARLKLEEKKLAAAAEKKKNADQTPEEIEHEYAEKLRHAELYNDEASRKAARAAVERWKRKLLNKRILGN